MGRVGLRSNPQRDPAHFSQSLFLMSLFRLSSFDPVPPYYQQALTSIRERHRPQDDARGRPKLFFLRKMRPEENKKMDWILLENVLDVPQVGYLREHIHGSYHIPK
jgi:hypothetical protein